MADDEARKRARRRLEERQARTRGDGRGETGSGRPRSSRPGTGNRHSWEARGADPLFAFVDVAMNAARAIGLARVAIGLAAIVLLVALVVGVRGCLAGPLAEEPAQAPVEQQPAAPIDEAALSAILGDELASQLVQAASTSDDVAWIAAHPQEYAMDGEAVQRKLLKLAAVEPEAVAFVRGFPDAYPADRGEPCDAPEMGKVPRLYQWDARWGSTVYSSTAFALTGCCPTSLAMVYQGLTGKEDLSPHDMALRAREGGYETRYDGTDAFFLVNEAAGLGLSCAPLSIDAADLRAALEDGAVVICNVGPGDFTEAGHFFVIAGIGADGTLSINDPYSAERSNRAWDVDLVLGQTMALYAYVLA